MTPETYHTAPPDDQTQRIRVRCPCGTYARNFRGVTEGIAFLRRAAPPPDLPVLTYFCKECKETVVVTAKQMGLCAA